MNEHTSDWKVGYLEQALRSIITNSNRDYTCLESRELALGRITAIAQMAIEEVIK
jgi:hypothetical protein